MKDRREPLRAQKKPGHLFVDLPGRGRIDLRLPTWSTTTRLGEWLGRRRDILAEQRIPDGAAAAASLARLRDALRATLAEPDPVAAVRALVAQEPVTDGSDGGAWQEYKAALVGVCWRHEATELEAVYPSAAPTDAAILAYAQAVEAELEEAGYRRSEIEALASACFDALIERRRETEAAEQLAGFSAPPPAATSSP